MIIVRYIADREKDIQDVYITEIRIQGTAHRDE